MGDLDLDLDLLRTGFVGLVDSVLVVMVTLIDGGYCGLRSEVIGLGLLWFDFALVVAFLVIWLLDCFGILVVCFGIGDRLFGLVFVGFMFVVFTLLRFVYSGLCARLWFVALVGVIVVLIVLVIMIL